MLMVDTRNDNARITLTEILASGRRYVSNPIAFGAFAQGFVFTPDLLLDKRLQLSSSASRRFAFFRTLMLELVPAIYDVRHLESLGGRFCLRIKAVGDFTVIAMNRRVVTLTGHPLDEESGKPAIDAEIRADALMGLCNSYISELSERILRTIAASRQAATPGSAV